ncbi:MAG: hypothetical protein COB09_19060 [Thalassobium sp.]|nr:MAG: hypothetical protein COB09_19060 [Thalassobium sp.]
MSNSLQLIETELKQPATMGRMSLALGFTDVDDPAAKNEARKYISSVLAEIEKTAGDPKKDLTMCSAPSIIRCMVDAAKMKMQIDGRQHAHLIKYGNNATLQIGYRGYLAKIKQAYPDAVFTVQPVYQGDEITVWHEDGNQFYKYVNNNLFSSGENNFLGILFAVTYTDGGRQVSKVSDVSKERVDRAKSAAKQKYVWGSDYIEKAKAAAIKNACKHLFASITDLQTVMRYDNDKNHKVDNNATDPQTRSILDNLNADIDSILPKKQISEDEGGVLVDEDEGESGEIITVNEDEVQIM